MKGRSCGPHTDDGQPPPAEHYQPWEGDRVVCKPHTALPSREQHRPKKNVADVERVCDAMPLHSPTSRPSGGHEQPALGSTLHIEGKLSRRGRGALHRQRGGRRPSAAQGRGESVSPGLRLVRRGVKECPWGMDDQRYLAEVIVTDTLASDGAAKRESLPRVA
jgi:hypothetical protein